MGLSREQRVELARDVFLFRMEIGFEPWPDAQLALRGGGGGVAGDAPPEALPSGEELWSRYESMIERQWPEYRDYCLRTYADEELTAYAEAYRHVAQERMRHAEYEEGLAAPAPDFEEVLARYARPAPAPPPANDNGGAPPPRRFLVVESAVMGQWRSLGDPAAGPARTPTPGELANDPDGPWRPGPGRERLPSPGELAEDRGATASPGPDRGRDRGRG